jgi:O-antigen/teichoic acid export membrane protein
MNLFSRILGTTVLARFYHASALPARLDQEVRTASSLVAVLAALYAGGIILLANPVVTFVFGQKFQASHVAMILLGAGAFMRFVRMEPFTEVMLNAGRTKRLAASNVLVASSLAYMVLLSFFDRSINAVLAARVLGEFTSFLVTFVMARRAPEGGRFVFSFSMVVAFLFVCVASLEAIALQRSGGSVALLLAAYGAYAIAVSLWGAADLRQRMRRLRAAKAQERKPEADGLAS